MNHKNQIPWLFLVLISVASCKLVSKARYGNGYKLNIENNWFDKKDVQNKKATNQHKFKGKSSIAQTKFLPIRKFNSNAQKNYPNKPISLCAKAIQNYEFKQPKLKSISQKTDNKFNKKPKLNKNLNTIRQKARKADRLPMEKNSIVALVLFIIFLFSLISILSNIGLFFALYPTPLMIIGLFMIIPAYIFAMRSKYNIKKSNYLKSGQTINYIVIAAASMIVFLLLIAIILT